jgi:hypothetical protein
MCHDRLRANGLFVAGGGLAGAPENGQRAQSPGRSVYFTSSVPFMLGCRPQTYS